MSRELVEFWVQRLDESTDRGPEIPLRSDDERIVQLYESLVDEVGQETIDDLYNAYLRGDNSSKAVGIAFLVDAYRMRGFSDEQKRVAKAHRNGEVAIEAPPDDASAALLAREVWRRGSVRKEICEAVRLILISAPRPGDQAAEPSGGDSARPTNPKLSVNDRLGLIYTNTPESREWSSKKLASIWDVTESAVRHCAFWKANAKRRRGEKNERPWKRET